MRQLHLGQAVADAAVDAEAERQVLARPLAVDDEGVGVLDHGLVAVARDVPHDHLVARLDGLAAELDVARRGAAHVGQRRLPADDLRHHRAGSAPGWRAACRTGRGSGSAPARRRRSSCGWCRCRRRSAARCCPRYSIGGHVPGGLAVGQHGDQVAAGGGVHPLVPQLREVRRGTPSARPGASAPELSTGPWPGWW